MSVDVEEQEASTRPSARNLALLACCVAGLGVSIVPASMRRLGGDDIAYRVLTDCPGLSAPLHLAMRRAVLSPVLSRFREVVRRLEA